MPFTPSPYQQRYFDWLTGSRGSAVLEAVAGSGKTTTIMEGARLMPPNASVRFVAFNKSIAGELNERLDALRRETGRALTGYAAGTFHSLGLGSVKKKLASLGHNRPIIDDKKPRTLLREFLNDDDYEMFSDYAVKMVHLARCEGIGCLVADADDAWFDLAAHHDVTLDSDGDDEARGLEIARQLLARSEIAARQRGLIDFDDMLYLPIRWKLRLWQNDFVIVDEAQDTNPVRRALLRLALRPGGRLVAVGDPCQAIYGFTGASHDAIDQIRADFSAVRLPLTVSYRCARRIVQLAQSIVPHLEASDSAPDGTVETLHPVDALAALGQGDAILCRNTAPLIKQAYAIIASGRGCQILGRDLGDGLTNLVKKLRARTIDSLEVKLTAFRDREVAKFTARGEETKAESVADRVECVQTIVNSLPETQRTVPALLAKIDSLFADKTTGLLLSTVHKSKGREWDTVAILEPKLMPSKWARQEWQQRQEQNLMYVAYTRAKRHLIFIDPNTAPQQVTQTKTSKNGTVEANQ